jgi:hypothetical protein
MARPHWWKDEALPKRERRPRWWIRVDWPELERAVDEKEPVVEIEDFLVPRRFGVTVIRDDVREDWILGPFSDEWPEVTLEIEIDHSRPVIRELKIGEQAALVNADGERISPPDYNEGAVDRAPPRPRRAINAALLRELPLARLAKHAMLGAAVRVGDGQGAEPVVPSDLRTFGFYRVGPGEVDDAYGIYYIDTPTWHELWSEEMDALSAYVDRASKTARRNRITDDLLARVAEVYRRAIADGSKTPKQAVKEEFNVSVASAGRYIMRARERGHLGKTRPGKKGEIGE